MSPENVMKWLEASAITLHRGPVSTSSGRYVCDSDPVPLSMTAVTMDENTVVKDTIITRGNARIGYLNYVGFTTYSEAAFTDALTAFNTQGVTDVVLDLRYNSGGTAST